MENSTATLHSVSRDLILHNLPLILGVLLACILGVVGNLLTAAFYRQGRQSSSTRLILALSCIDTAVCLANLGIVAHMFLNVLLSSPVACKAIYTVVLWTIYCSVLTLWAISFDRYFKLCRPFGRQLSVKNVNVIVAMLMFVAAAMASRVIVTQVVIPITATLHNHSSDPNATTGTVVGYLCTASDQKSDFIWALQMLEMALFVLSILTLVISYSKILQTLYTHRKNYASFRIDQNRGRIQADHSIATETDMTKETTQYIDTDNSTQTSIISDPVDTMDKDKVAEDSCKNSGDSLCIALAHERLEQEFEQGGNSEHCTAPSYIKCERHLHYDNTDLTTPHEYATHSKPSDVLETPTAHDCTDRITETGCIEENVDNDCNQANARHIFDNDKEMTGQIKQTISDCLVECSQHTTPQDCTRQEREIVDTLKIEFNYPKAVEEPVPVTNPDQKEDKTRKHSIIVQDNSWRRKVLSHRKPGLRTRSNAKDPTQSMRASERRVTIMMFVASVAYLCFFLPGMVMKVATDKWKSYTEADYHIGKWLPFLLPMCNSVINPILYCVLNKRFRRFVMQKVCCR